MTKRLLTLALGAGLLSSTAVYGQLPVSTTPENKNIVLEEFTGIYCGFCPDGHLRATNLSNANPGDVVLINVHAGPFANPSGNDPDFTTNFGDSIDIISNVAGYPAGNINRRVFSNFSQNPGGMAMSRGNWTSAGGTVLNESSYVNVAIEGDIDITTNVLTVDVEMYFTSNGPTDVNLNVALLQNYISGPQSGSSGNPSQVNPDGTYNHMHMLRDLLTGQWGEVINTTTSGTTVTRTYTYNLPASINNIPVSIGDMEVVAFVTEGQTDVVTGATGPMNFTAPAGSVVADLSASAGATSSSDFCDPNFTPEVTINNNSNQAASNFEVSYSINGGTPVTQTVSAALNGGSATTVTFNATTLSAGVNIITYEVSTANNNSLYDLTAGNNTSSSDPVIVVNATPFGTYWYEDFESHAVLDDDFQNAHTINPDGNGFGVMNQNFHSSVTWATGGYGNSANSLFFDFYNTGSGGDMSVMWEKLDLSTTTGNSIAFDLAYAQYTSENDRLDIEVSTDCGATWNSVYSKSGSTLSTRTATTSFYIPNSGDWRTDVVDISSYDGTAELMIRFTGTSNYGNNLYVDNIQFRNNTYVSLDENNLAGGFKFYPNPAEDQLQLEFDLNEQTEVSLRILDITGREVYTMAQESMENGFHNKVISLNVFPAGSYFVEVNMNGQVSVEKLLVK